MTTCLNCFTCQKGVAPNVTAADQVSPGAKPCQAKAQNQNEKPARTMTYFIFLTNACNLACSYCYAHKKPIEADRAVLEAIIKYIAATERAEREKHSSSTITIQFFGGEPTTRWADLCWFTDAISFILREAGVTPRFGMTTNATLLDERRLFWMRQREFKPLFSLDGRPETHDRHRRLPDGSGSSRLINYAAIANYFPNAEIRPTLMPDTIGDWMQDLRWFYDREFYRIATEPNYEAEWDPEAMATAKRVYSDMAELYIRRRRAGLPMWMKFIEDGKARGQRTGRVCGTAENVLAFDAAANIYACQRYASYSDPKLRIGTAKEGLFKMEAAVARALRLEMMYPAFETGLLCDECGARWRCRGGCNAMNFDCYGDRKIVHQTFCAFMRMWAAQSLYALSATGELWGGGQQSAKSKGEKS